MNRRRFLYQTSALAGLTSLHTTWLTAAQGRSAEDLASDEAFWFQVRRAFTIERSTWHSTPARLAAALDRRPAVTALRARSPRCSRRGTIITDAARDIATRFGEPRTGSQITPRGDVQTLSMS
jgi:hypothetical protein